MLWIFAGDPCRFSVVRINLNVKIIGVATQTHTHSTRRQSRPSASSAGRARWSSAALHDDSHRKRRAVFFWLASCLHSLSLCLSLSLSLTLCLSVSLSLSSVSITTRIFFSFLRNAQHRSTKGASLSHDDADMSFSMTSQFPGNVPKSLSMTPLCPTTAQGSSTLTTCIRFT